MVSISACHAEDPGSIPGRGVFSCADTHSASKSRLAHLIITNRHRAHGVVVSHPLRMRKALGSNPTVSILSHFLLEVFVTDAPELAAIAKYSDKTHR